MKGITLICSGYGNEKEEDILTVRLDPKGKAQMTGGVRQQDSPSWICAKDGVLYAVSEQVGRAFIGRRSIREDGSLTEEEGRIELPGGNLGQSGSRHGKQGGLQPAASLRRIQGGKDRAYMLHEVIGVFQPPFIAACSQQRRKDRLVVTQDKRRVQPRQANFRQFRTTTLQKNDSDS